MTIIVLHPTTGSVVILEIVIEKINLFIRLLQQSLLGDFLKLILFHEETHMH